VETWGEEGEGRTAGLFCRHLDDLCRAFRHYRVIHVICDNAFNHRPDRSKVVRAYQVAWGERISLQFRRCMLSTRVAGPTMLTLPSEAGVGP
jgi:hypothetical protein